ncbi:MAG: hypothetical protein JHC93_04080 [Parachlamydiales bacterium]|nr:hypothetical protein [Parachlamydiales bacterium]
MDMTNLNFSNVYIVCFILPLLLASIHIWCSRSYVFAHRKIELFLIYFIVFNVGVGGIIHGIWEMMFKEIPYYQLGMAQLAFGCLGFLALFNRGGGFWLATGTGYSLYLFANFIFDSVKMSENNSYDWHTVGPEYYISFLVPLTICILFGLLKRELSKDV